MIPILLDYETLRIIWWLLLGVLLIGLAVMDGFDMGVAFLNLWLGKNDVERRIIINTIGPVWEGNQVWLLLGAGAIFAAFPAIYATAFSGFYIAMLAVLLSLILRPVSLEFRNKFTERKRHYWDVALFMSGFIPPLVFGVAFGNLFLGVPFYLDSLHMPHYVIGATGIGSWWGGFFMLLNPFGLLCGLVSLSMMITHGGVYLSAKTTGAIQERAKKVIYTGALVWLILFIIGGLFVGKINGYIITSPIVGNGPSNPLLKEVASQVGAWQNNYRLHPYLYIIPSLACLGALITIFFTSLRLHAIAFFTSGLMIAGTIATAGVALFPFLMPSSFDPKHSLTVWDATSSHFTLWLMTLATVVFIPLIILYTSWLFYVMRKPVNEETIKEHSNSLY